MNPASTLFHAPPNDSDGGTRGTDAPVGVSLSDSALEAYATVRTSGPISRSSIVNALQKEGIVTGYLDQAIEELTSEDGARGYPVLVAQGSSPESGINAQIELFFERNPKPKVSYDSEGNVNYKEVGVIQQVKEGDLLAQKTPARRGEPGITVTGKEIAGRIGRDQNLIAGPGTRFEDEDRTRLIAARSGVVSIHPNSEVQVSDQFIIDGDVDYAVGNVRFNGAVLVRGSVVAGFTIVAEGDVEVRGVVEDATIHCGGNLHIRGGFLGKGKGEVRVAGNTHIRFLENQTVVCNGDVHIAEEIVFGNVTCGGSVVVQYGKGAVIGGVINARKGIRVKTAGNIHHQRTRLVAGKDPVLLDRIDEATRAVSRKQTVKGLVQDGIDVLVHRKYEDHEPLDSEAEDALDTLYESMSHFDAWVEEMTELRDRMLDQQRAMESAAFIRVEHRIYPNVFLTIGDKTRMIDEENTRTEYRLVEGQITGSTKRGYR